MTNFEAKETEIINTVYDFKQVEEELHCLIGVYGLLRKFEDSIYISENICPDEVTDILQKIVEMEKILYQKYAELKERVKSLIHGKRG